MAEGRSAMPPMLAAIADAAGEEVALTIARMHGGTRVKIPVRPGRNWLTALVGPAAAAAVIEALGPTSIVDVPLGPISQERGYYELSRREFARRLAELEAANAPAATIARVLGVTERAVRMRRAERRARAVGDLFEDR